MNIGGRVAAALCLIIAASVESVGPFFFTARSLVHVPALEPETRVGLSRV